MRGTITLDQAGRIVLPKGVRDELHLSPGDTLDVMVEGDQVILRPRRADTPLEKERGVWVFRTGKPLTAAETQAVVRNLGAQRRHRNLGESQ